MIPMRSLRSTRLAPAAALLLAFAPAAPRALAQDAAPAPSSTADSVTGAPLVAAPTASNAQSGSTAQSGLPPQSGPPRTLRAYWHVFIAFTLAWLLLFGYALSLGRRFGKVERELDAMRGTS